MEKKQSDQEKRERKPESEGEKGKLEAGLPLETSPYVNYGDLEDYKRQAYGTEGHLEPKTGRGAGATDAPTPSGAAVSSDTTGTNVTNRQGLP